MNRLRRTGTCHLKAISTPTQNTLTGIFLILLHNADRGFTETTTCDSSYTGNGRTCVSYNFLCNTFSSSTFAQTVLPTCFSGSAQSPIDLNVNSVTVEDSDENSDQITFTGYNDQLEVTPHLRLRDFTVQLDFEETVAVSLQSLNLSRRRRRRASRNANLPSVTGGALGNDT